MAKRQVQCAAAAIAILVAAPVAAQAQSGRRVSVEAAATFGSLTGDDFEGTDASAGFDVAAFLNLNAWQFGAGYARSAYGHETLAGEFVVSGIFIEPRYQFGASDAQWRPYLAARIGRASASGDERVLGQPVSFEGDGLLLGAGVGLLLEVTSRFQLILAAHASRVSFDYGGINGSSSDESGNQVGVRVGGRVGVR